MTAVVNITTFVVNRILRRISINKRSVEGHHMLLILWLSVILQQCVVNKNVHIKSTVKTQNNSINSKTPESVHSPKSMVWKPINSSAC